jgi:predicted DNA-binding transcriptional regulator YafY
MSKLERLYHLHDILSHRRTPISRHLLMEQLECSQATLYRLIADLRDHLGAPIEQDSEGRGFYYESHGLKPFELPGIWLSPEELQALLSAREVLASVQPGLLENELETLQKRISSLLETKGVDTESLGSRIRIIHQAGRLVDSDVFRSALGGLVGGKRIQLNYHSRGRDEQTERVISPQRLTSYRHNWYLDAWCHLRKGLRSFALERCVEMQLLPDAVRSVDVKELNQHLTSAYGIFSGPAKHQATLRFSATMARWVADELWHSRQETRWLKDGRYELTIPFGRTEELIMDILRFGGEVEVLEPDFLREAVISSHQAALKRLTAAP